MKRKNYILKISGVLLVLFMLNACVDVLDKVPSDKIGIDRILSTHSVQNFRTNSYSNLNQTFTNFYAGQLLEAYSDDAFRAGTGVTFDWHNGTLSPESNMFASTLWNQYWQGIRKCNQAIEYLPQATISKDIISDQDLANWYDEVKLLRAWYHFSLIKNFGPVPFIDEAFSADFVEWDQLTRPTYDQVVARIVSEIDEVIENGLLPLRWQVSNDYNKVQMAVAYALKSRVLLYNASLLNNPGGDTDKWQDAADAARACLDNVIPEYQLVSIGEYPNLFNESVSVRNSEVILRGGANRTAVMNSNNGVDLSALGSPTQASNCGAVPTQELVDCFELTDGTLPVASYNNTAHTDVAFNPGYTEAAGTDPYAGRDARLYHSIVFNGAQYGKYKGMAAAAPELTIYTYLGKQGTGFNDSPTSDAENDKRRSTTGYYGRKFRTASFWGGQTGGTNAHKIFFRLAEVYLNLAEAECELGNLDEAMDALNVIRERAGQPLIENVPGFSKTKGFLMNRIRNERRVELCFEGHRFYDQRRWRILGDTNGAVTGMKISSSDGTDQGTFSYTRVEIGVPRQATSDKYLVLPLPLEEARRLPGIGQPGFWN